MSSVRHLREFIRERLTAAAEEIFTEVEKNVVHYEEELDRQRKLLEICWKPRIQLQRIDVPRRHVSVDEEAPPADQQVCNQSCNSSMDQVEPESLLLKQELEDLAIQEEEQLLLKHELDRFSVTPTHERNDDDDPELNRDDIPVYTCPIDEDLHFEKSKLEDPGPAGYAELSPENSSLRNNDDNVENSLLLESHSETELTAEKLYVCYTCNKRFSHLSSLQRHQAVHSNEKPYSCTVCGKSFAQRHLLLRHMICHAPDRPYSCKTCGKCFRSKSHLLSHMKTHTGERPYSCKICGKRFSRNGHLMRHMRCHAPERPYSCKTCGICFHRSSHLLSHMRTHTGENVHSCKTCGKRFHCNSHLLNHVRTHTGERPYSCKICGKSFGRNSHLMRHVRIHTEVPNQDVPVDEEAPPADQQLCSQGMNQVEPESLILKEELEDLAIQEEAQLVLNHQMDRFSVTPTHDRNGYNDPQSNRDNIPVYTCPIDEHLHLEKSKLEDPGPARYGELSPENSSLRNNDDNVENSLLSESHSETEHTAEKLYVCYTCNKRFSHLSSLQKHQAVHSNEKPYFCTVCGKSFGQRNLLLRHLRCHTAERPHSCKVCGKGFRTNSHLLSHMRTHTGERPYSCKICGKSFSRNGHLMRHIKIHTGEKPYSCVTCGKSFSRNSHLMRHESIHRAEEIFM